MVNGSMVRSTPSSSLAAFVTVIDSGPSVPMLSRYARPLARTIQRLQTVQPSCAAMDDSHLCVAFQHRSPSKGRTVEVEEEAEVK